ncbi:MAG: DUF288 domain-containing protein, partial [Okeania sp. SIO2D1]|nr:DUF288 domain-containing protein [Okeania sp. SIO2D1]
MNNKFAVVITSINHPTEAILEIAKKAQDDLFDFIVIGDRKSPTDFEVDGCCFLSLEEQLKSDFVFARNCPKGHYARKNIGYLIAISRNCSYIVETDDDNIPFNSFWQPRKAELSVPQISQKGWVNVYKYFSDSLIWPRGLPLNAIHSEVLP